MEMHANSGPEPYMRGLTDPLVDELRKQYALDIYKSIALPIYGTPPSMTTWTWPHIPSTIIASVYI